MPLFIDKNLICIGALVLKQTPNEKIDSISQAQRERLFHIDFKLRFLGSINRNDLVDRFGIKEAAATRDISIYKDLASDNLNYDTKAKTYSQTKKFVPLFSYDDKQAVSALSIGFGDDYVSNCSAMIPTESPTQLNLTSLDCLAEITKAIYKRKALLIEYRSLTSGLSKREVVPLGLVNNGLRWHVRAFDRRKSVFSDFVINRILGTELLDGEIGSNETKENDIQWNRIVEMHIVPHPKLKHPKTIEIEYGMVNGMLKLQVRAAVAGYVLRHWNIDCSEGHELLGPEIHLWLKNLPTLYAVENLVIAPGYASSKLSS